VYFYIEKKSEKQPKLHEYGKACKKPDLTLLYNNRYSRRRIEGELSSLKEMPKLCILYEDKS
jgi:hypothetical protein